MKYLFDTSSIYHDTNRHAGVLEQCSLFHVSRNSRRVRRARRGDRTGMPRFKHSVRWHRIDDGRGVPVEVPGCAGLIRRV